QYQTPVELDDEEDD
ncbi:hypothetical protein ABHC02_21290, partial [Escherichia coli]